MDLKDSLMVSVPRIGFRATFSGSCANKLFNRLDLLNIYSGVEKIHE